MSLDGPCGEDRRQAAVPTLKTKLILPEELDLLSSIELVGAEVESLDNQSICNPIRTPSCNTSVVGCGSSRRRSNHAALACIVASTASAAFVITPPSSCNNTPLSSTQLTACSIDSRGTQRATSSTRTSRPGTPKYGDCIITCRPITPKLTRPVTPKTPSQSPRLIAASTPDTFYRKSSFSRLQQFQNNQSAAAPSTSSSESSLSSQVNRILFSQAPTPTSSSSRCSKRCSRLCPNPALSSATTASRDPRNPPFQTHHHHQIEPYARCRNSDPQGFLFTCYLDYNRFIKPTPPSFTEIVVRPESLQFTNSTCPSTCEIPRSSTSASSSSTLSLTSRRIFNSRPTTPAPTARVKEVHKITMTGVPIDVKELSNCYLFVAEIPGLKNTDVKVQVENDSILKICGDRKREDCDECEVKYIRVERQVGRFARKFNLPINADVERISAACQDGLLSVVIPKNPPYEQRRPKNFEVKIAT